MTQAIYAHVFVLHETIADLPLNKHKWSKQKIFFDFDGHDDTYVAMLNSHEKIEEFKKQQEMPGKTYLNSEIVEPLSNVC